MVHYIVQLMHTTTFVLFSIPILQEREKDDEKTSPFKVAAATLDLQANTDSRHRSSLVFLTETAPPTLNPLISKYMTTHQSCNPKSTERRRRSNTILQSNRSASFCRSPSPHFTAEEQPRYVGRHSASPTGKIVNNCSSIKTKYCSKSTLSSKCSSSSSSAVTKLSLSGRPMTSSCHTSHDQQTIATSMPMSSNMATAQNESWLTHCSRDMKTAALVHVQQSFQSRNSICRVSSVFTELDTVRTPKEVYKD